MSVKHAINLSIVDIPSLSIRIRILILRVGNKLNLVVKTSVQQPPSKHRLSDIAIFHAQMSRLEESSK